MVVMICMCFYSTYILTYINTDIYTHIYIKGEIQILFFEVFYRVYTNSELDDFSLMVKLLELKLL